MEPVRIERLDTGRHDHSAFSCGDITIDRWLQLATTSAVNRVGTSVQVATNGQDIIACYQLSAFQIEAEAETRGGALRSAAISAILVSHLAVDLHNQHRGLGTAVLVHALQVAERAPPH